MILAMVFLHSQPVAPKVVFRFSIRSRYFCRHDRISNYPPAILHDPTRTHADQQMIQRKQSLFLLLAALLAFATWLFPIATHHRDDGTFTFKTIGLYAEDGVEVADVGLKIPFAALLTVIGAGMVFCIFLYNNRTRQMRFVRAVILLSLSMSAAMFITDNSIKAYLKVDHVLESTYGLSFYMPLVMIVLSIMAERSIKADDALVRSADRLR